MKKLPGYLLLFFFAFNSHVIYAGPRYIIVIGIDGLGAYGLKRAHTPVMDSLKDYGSYSMKVKAVHPTLSNPNWASMLMGVDTREHKIKDNEWRKADIRDKSFCQGETGKTYPTVFACINRQDSLSNLLVVHQWKEFSELVEEECLGVLEYTSNEELTISRSCNYLDQYDSAFMFIHLDHVDKAGHAYGLKSKEYRGAVEKADSLIGVVIQKIRNKGMFHEAVFVIVSDHGFRGKGHGGRSRKERRVPLIVSGKQIKAGFLIPRKVRIFDIAPTLALLYGVLPEQCWSGSAIQSIFD